MSEVRGTVQKAQRAGGRVVWEAKIRVQDPATGMWRWRTKVGGPTRRDAMLALAQMLAASRTAAEMPADLASITVAELAHRWVDTRRPEWSPKRTMEVERQLRLRILKSLGDRQIGRIGVADAREFVAALHREGLSAHSVSDIRAVAHALFAEAVLWGAIVRNPFTGVRVRIPSRPAGVKVPDGDVLDRVLDVAARFPGFDVYVRLAVVVGARRGELCALRWEDVHGGVLTISRSFGERAAGEGWAIKGTKTHQEREVPLDPETAEAVAAWRRRCAEQALAAGVPLPEWVFPSRSGGPMVPTVASKRWRKVRSDPEVNLLALRLHDLRHINASLLLARGVDVRTVSGRLGHRNPATTLNVYAQAVQRADEHAAQVAGSIFSTDGSVSHAK